MRYLLIILAIALAAFAYSCSDPADITTTCPWGNCTGDDGNNTSLDEGDNRSDNDNNEDNNGDATGGGSTEEKEDTDEPKTPVIPNPTPSPKPDPEPKPEPEPDPEPEGDGTPLGSFKWTYYYIVYEADYTGPKVTPIYRLDKSVIAMARDEFAKDVSIEWTGYLENGTLINGDDECSFAKYGLCFTVIPDSSGCAFGHGSESNCLRPFRSVAADNEILAFGTKLYIPLLDGQQMPGPNGFLHDGCVAVEDTGTSIIGKHLDFFSEKEAYYHTIDDILLCETEYVDVYKDSPKCE